MTQMEAARRGTITPEMAHVARAEGASVEVIAQRVAEGKVVILKNRLSPARPVGVGQGLRTKVNANVGTSSELRDVELEVRKARVAVEAGADTVMDLSTGGPLDEVRRAVRKAVDVPLGTVPVYQAAVEVAEAKGGIVHMTADDLFRVLEKQAEDGVDFFTVHCGVTLSALERLRKQGRTLDVVSRGGSFLITWMVYHAKENPLYEQFDRLLDLARKYDVTLSLGDGMRPGSLADATDRAQIQELITLGELTKAAWEHGVQVMIEGPGHVPLDQIEMNMQLEKRLCHGAPFYVLGPLVTDVAPGYDHIVCAIGGALAAKAGADFLCYVTPAEHLRLPSVEDVREGVIVTRIAAHAADIAKGIPSAWEWDRRMSEARRRLDWHRQFELAIDGEKARRMWQEAAEPDNGACSMCGEYCAIKLVEKALGGVQLPV
ncbi:MAG: phosphomethylpyrimidine synthase ThiC [candidate division KSB1 bacterium]|nr:phosphomethylpyrimidine synthase ThiC [candidate division KSB1 bacterium]